MSDGKTHQSGAIATPRAYRIKCFLAGEMGRPSTGVLQPLSRMSQSKPTFLPASSTRFLPAVAESRKAEEGGPHCVCAEAADHPQHYDEDGFPLGSDHSQALTLKTVATAI